METYQVLEKALRLIEDEKDWHQGGCWGAGGVARGPYCAGGALYVADPEGHKFWGAPAYCALGELIEARNLPRFNDSHSHAEVVALFQTAIRNEKAKAGVLVDEREPVAA